MIHIHLLALPSWLQAESFQTFARTRYLPALANGTVGSARLAGVQLLRRRRADAGEPAAFDNQFLLIADWQGEATGLPRAEDPTVQRPFDIYAPTVTPIGQFETIGTLMTETA